MEEEKKIKGTIFDIRRFSTHDGDGIRTTLFLKGCPLSCVWCHNPEGINRRQRTLYFPNKCIHCGTCVHLSRNLGVIEKMGSICIDITKKENWEEIIRECPTGALVSDSRILTVQEAIHEILKDEPFFRHGGGVTLSGGEPLLQREFVIELLKELKKLGIHTAIETALLVPEETVREVMPYLDLIYADMKLFLDNEHKKYTGVSNDLIKKNIKLLLESEKKDKVIIRTPMIPNITTKEENISLISNYISGIYSDVSYEILNYNPLAESKYHLIDKDYYFKKNPSKYSKEEMKKFANIAKDNGVKYIILES